MWTQTFLWLVFIFSAALIKTGSMRKAAMVTVLLSPIFLFASYFSSRQTPTASKTERFFAKAWLIVRRLVCFSGAALAFTAGTVAILQGSILGGSASIALGAFVVWTGFFGAGYKRGFVDDRPVHQERKKRYGWK